MSLSNPSLQNPAKHFIEWSGSKGTLSWYNKETKQNIPVKIPFEFIVLDELSTITGYSDADESGFWSNEVRSIVKDELHVKTKKGTRYVGIYKNDQGMPQVPQGARYTKSVYIAHLGGSGELIMGNLKLTGAALTSWIEFSKQHKVDSGKVRLTGSTDGKKGATEYKIPTFEFTNYSTEEFDSAVILDRELQIYLSQYLATPKEDETPYWPSDVAKDETLATPEQVAEFEQMKTDKLGDSEDLAAIFGENPMNPDGIDPNDNPFKD